MSKNLIPERPERKRDKGRLPPIWAKGKISPWANEIVLPMTPFAFVVCAKCNKMRLQSGLRRFPLNITSAACVTGSLPISQIHSWCIVGQATTLFCTINVNIAITHLFSRNSMSGLRTMSESLAIAVRCDDWNLIAPELDTLPSSRPTSITLRRISAVRLPMHAIIIHFVPKNVQLYIFQITISKNNRF